MSLCEIKSVEKRITPALQQPYSIKVKHRPRHTKTACYLHISSLCTNMYMCENFYPVPSKHDQCQKNYIYISIVCLCEIADHKSSLPYIFIILTSPLMRGSLAQQTQLQLMPSVFNKLFVIGHAVHVYSCSDRLYIAERRSSCRTG